MLISRFFKNFLKVEKSGSLLLLISFTLAFTIANTSFSESFNQILKFNLLHLSLTDWINEGLMTLFFLQVGLEIKRELVEGELSDFKVAGLPVFGAIGGMIVPAALYLLFTVNTNYTKGFGIPMATDIALSLAVISLLGNKIPTSLKLFLASLAIIDDLGAIAIIAIFYNTEFQLTYLLVSLIILLLINYAGYKKVTFLPLYAIGLILLWIVLHKAGIHPSISGALIAFAIPFKQFNNEERFLLPLHKLVNYGIIPIFILVNALIDVRNIELNNLFTHYTMGVFVGLTLGKPIGIILFCWISLKLKIAKLAKDLNYSLLLGAGIFAGIGFTMSIFVSLLAFTNSSELNAVKIIITLAGIFSTLIGVAYFKLINFKPKRNN